VGRAGEQASRPFEAPATPAGARGAPASPALGCLDEAAIFDEPRGATECGGAAWARHVACAGHINPSTRSTPARASPAPRSLISFTLLLRRTSRLHVAFARLLSPRYNERAGAARWDGWRARPRAGACSTRGAFCRARACFRAPGEAASAPNVQRHAQHKLGRGGRGGRGGRPAAGRAARRWPQRAPSFSVFEQRVYSHGSHHH